MSLRASLLSGVSEPVIVMETHGGLGKLWQACYSDIKQGVVFEKDQSKADVLAKQRPEWAVYEGDCIKALEAGAGSHLEVNFVDLDPYGECWPVVDAFLFSKRPKPDTLYFAVNDGLRNKLKLNGAWTTGSMEKIVQKFGNNLYKRYLDICEELIHEKAAQAGYGLSRFWGYYAGHGNDMTHYAAILSRA